MCIRDRYLYMMYVWGHSFEFRTEEDWALMEQFCQLAGGREDTWYAVSYTHLIRIWKQNLFAGSGAA